MLAEADLVFLALPHGQSAALVGQLPPTLPIIDLGADFRLDDPADWERFYGSDARRHVDLRPARATGGTRAIRTRGASRTRAATSPPSPWPWPRCWPTTSSTADDLVVVAASGTSGAGRAAKASLLASEVMGSMSAYKVGGGHQHTPEIVQNLRRATGRHVTLSFTPTLAPMPRGILATCSAPLADGATDADVLTALRQAYQAEPFVHVLPPGRWPTTGATLGSNAVHLQAAVDVSAGRVTVVAAEDNLVKGAAGQALQNANLVLGLPETMGLTARGVAP